MTLNEAAKTARELMMPKCRMCPECNGVVCRGEVPGIGGKGTGSSFMNNYSDLKKITLNMRTIHDVREPDLRFTLFGQELSMPVMPAPVTGVNINMGGKVSEEDYIRAVIRGSKNAGIIPMVGDSAFKSFIEDNLKVLKEEGVSGIPFIKPWNNDELLSRIDMAMTSNPLAIGVDIDSAGLDTLKMHGQRVDPKSLSELKMIRDHVKIPSQADARCLWTAASEAALMSSRCLHWGQMRSSSEDLLRSTPSAEKKRRWSFMQGKSILSLRGPCSLPDVRILKQ